MAVKSIEVQDRISQNVDQSREMTQIVSAVDTVLDPFLESQRDRRVLQFEDEAIRLGKPAVTPSPFEYYFSIFKQMHLRNHLLKTFSNFPDAEHLRTEIEKTKDVIDMEAAFSAAELAEEENWLDFDRQEERERELREVLFSVERLIDERIKLMSSILEIFSSDDVQGTYKDFEKQYIQLGLDPKSVYAISGQMAYGQVLKFYQTLKGNVRHLKPNSNSIFFDNYYDSVLTYLSLTTKFVNLESEIAGMKPPLSVKSEVTVLKDLKFRLKPFLDPAHAHFYKEVIDNEELLASKIDPEDILNRKKKLLQEKLLNVRSKIKINLDCLPANLVRLFDKLLHPNFLQDMLFEDPALKELEEVGVPVDNKKNSFVSLKTRLIYQIIFNTINNLNKLEVQLDIEIKRDLEFKRKFDSFKKKDKSLENLALLSPESNAVTGNIKPQNQDQSQVRTQDLGQIPVSEAELQCQREYKAFKEEQAKRLEAWCMRVQSEQLRKQVLKTANQTVESDLKKTQEVVKSETELSDFEVSQLLCVFENIKSHYETLEAVLDLDINCCFPSVEKLIYASSNGLINPAIYKDFKLLRFVDGSHFNAYIPNTKLQWQGKIDRGLPNPVQTETFSQFIITPQEMSNLHSWHHSNIMSLLALKHARRDLIKAGLTPERFQQAFARVGKPFPFEIKKKKKGQRATGL